MKNRKEFIDQLKENVIVIAVSKNRSRDEIEQLYHEGISIFGENKVQELNTKARPDDPWQWHFIGHLQTNKVKDVVSRCSMIHSIDSIRLLHEVDKQATKIKKVMEILIQINLSEEASKFGCAREEVYLLLDEINRTSHVRLRGIMVMGPLSEDKNKTEAVFKEAKRWFDSIKNTHPTINILSMGMSGDYEIAIENGSTMVRIGTLLFEWD